MPPLMSKLVWAKLKSPFPRAGKSPKEKPKLDVDEEYKEAFRTKSYEEILSKVQEQKRKTCIDHGLDRLSSSSSSSLSASLSLPFYVHLADHLFEPQSETLKEMIERLNCHRFLRDYFEASLEACDTCDLLLRCVHHVRSNNQKFERVMRLSKRLQDSGDNSDKIPEAVLRELTAYAIQRNPLSSISPAQFRDVHVSNLVLLDRLTSERRKIRRRVKLNRIFKKVGACSLVISHTALVIVLLALALHGLVGIVAAPALVTCSLHFFRKRIKLISGSHLPSKTSLLHRICVQLDLASKGTYILINDFDTIGRLVRRLYDEIEHWKVLADMCVRNKRADLLKEFVKEFYLRHSCYLEQLEELERHVYLCFNSIDRSRKHVIQEILMGAAGA